MLQASSETVFLDVLFWKMMKNHSWEQRNDFSPGEAEKERQERRGEEQRKAQAGYGPKLSAVKGINGPDMELFEWMVVIIPWFP